MSDNILVGVRLRPLISREVGDGSAIHWNIGAENTITQIDPVSRKSVCPPYKFDRVFGMDYNNEDIYHEMAEGIVEAALAGFNGTIFAYGQTSSGKSYTMMGDRQNAGVIPLAIQNIFQSIENNPEREYLIRVSYMEIYNENITDLLSEREQKSKGLAIREDISGAVYVVDLKEECVNSEEMLLSLMKKGNKNRHVGITNMNERSSRSHTIFRLILESRERSDVNSDTEAVTVSQLNFVDLAGAENASQTGATGERLKEGSFINKSLHMLGHVISQLSEGEQFVNFRDSKLTRILQTSLGGNAKTAVICTVTPVGVDQTHSTLRFASRAKSIKNKPIVNEVMSEAALLKRYAKEIKNLQESLARERKTDKAQEVEQVREMLDEKERKNQELEAKVNELKTKLVVSSLPRESSGVGAIKKKLRRETWAAPATFRAMRMSMAPVCIEPIKLDQDFLHPMLPARVNQNKIESEADLSDGNLSTTSDGFGKENGSSLDWAEQSKLGKLDHSFDTASSWKRVNSQLYNSKDVADAECQTDDSLLPQLQLQTCMESLEKQLDEALAKKGEAEQELNEMKIKFSEVSVLDEKLEMETLVSQMEIMKAELHRAEDQAKSLAEENADLKLQVNQMETSEALSRVQELELENQLLRERLEVDSGEPVFILSPASQTDISTAFEISPKISESLQVLEESQLPSTPRKGSACFSEPCIQQHSLATFKEQLHVLQETPLAQELQFQHEAVSDTLQELIRDQRICREEQDETQKSIPNVDLPRRSSRDRRSPKWLGVDPDLLLEASPRRGRGRPKKLCGEDYTPKGIPMARRGRPQKLLASKPQAEGALKPNFSSKCHRRAATP